MKENEDYELIPVDNENDQAWHIRILTGDFVESVLAFGNVAINGEHGYINFNFNVVSSPDPEVSDEREDVQKVAGEILTDILERSIKDGSVLLKERK